MHAMNVVQMSCPFITSLHSVIIIMYPQTIFLDYQITRDSKKNHLLRAIVTGNFVDISFFITYSVIGNRKTRYLLPESFKTSLFGHVFERTLKNMYSRSLSKRVILAIFLIYCFHFLVVHTVYALRKCHCISKIYLRILHLKDSESTLLTFLLFKVTIE